MVRRSAIRLSLFLLFLACFISAAAAGKPVTVFVSILPQKYFVERIGGNRVNVGVLVGPGQSPATYEPTPKQMAGLSEAAVFFRIGVPFENRLMEKIQNVIPHLPIVDSRSGVTPIEMKDHVHPDHGDQGVDPHIWMDPKRATIIASTMAGELIRLDPDHTDFYRENLAALQKDLDQLDRKISSSLKPYQGRAFLVFHPAYGYFADSYGLTQIAVEQEGKSPGPRQVVQWIDRAKSDQVRFIFVQPQFSRTSAESIAAAVGATVVAVDPLAENYIENLEGIAKTIQEALQDR